MTIITLWSLFLLNEFMVKDGVDLADRRSDHHDDGGDLRSNDDVCLVQLEELLHRILISANKDKTER